MVSLFVEELGAVGPKNNVNFHPQSLYFLITQDDTPSVASGLVVAVFKVIGPTAGVPVLNLDRTITLWLEFVGLDDSRLYKAHTAFAMPRGCKTEEAGLRLEERDDAWCHLRHGAS